MGGFHFVCESFVGLGLRKFVNLDVMFSISSVETLGVRCEQLGSGHLGNPDTSFIYIYRFKEF